jgi:hypothetical protein
LRTCGEALVLGPEVVSPEADAVRLVHDEEFGLEARHQPLERAGSESLGRDVEQPLEKPSTILMQHLALVLQRAASC